MFAIWLVFTRFFMYIIPAFLGRSETEQDMEIPEIERKYLVSSFPKEVLCQDRACWSEQGYLAIGAEHQTTRVRTVICHPHFVVDLENIATTPAPSREIKGWKAFCDRKWRDREDDWKSQIEDSESITLTVAWLLIDKRAVAGLTKVRFRFDHGGKTMELDIFTKPALRGLVMLEVELKSPDEPITLPPGIVAVEVTEDARFRNVNLARLESLDSLTPLVSPRGAA